MTLLNETEQKEIRQRRRQVILIPLLTIVLSWLGAPPGLLACGEPPSNESDVADTGMTLKDVTHGSLLFKSPVAGRYVPAPLLRTNVNIAVTGTISRTVLTQEFVNPSRVKDDWAEGI